MITITFEALFTLIIIIAVSTTLLFFYGIDLIKENHYLTIQVEELSNEKFNLIKENRILKIMREEV